MKTTNVWVILDEEKLKIVKHRGKVFIFKSKEDAEVYASNKLNIWKCINVHFEDQWIEHKPKGRYNVQYVYSNEVNDIYSYEDEYGETGYDYIPRSMDMSVKDGIDYIKTIYFI